MNQYIVKPFIILNELEYINNSLCKRDELIVISNRMKKAYTLFNNNMNENYKYLYANKQINENTIKILNYIKENIENEEKEYNKIMNEIYKFNVDS
jgi:hypothetical protein